MKEYSAQIPLRQRNYSQMIYTFTFGLLSISLSTYNFVQSELPLPNIRSVYRYMNEIMIIKPFMLTNLSYLPQILNEYKNIIKNDTQANEFFILAVNALSTTSFANIRKKLSITGLMTDEINADESFLMVYSVQKFENYIHKDSD